MPRFETGPDAKALGEGLAALRRERGLSQADAGQRIGMTSQGWGLYESGRRPGLFRPDVQRRLLAALDATPEDLALRTGTTATKALADLNPGFQARGQPYAAPPSAPGSTRRLSLSSDDLAPWAASGVVLEYDTSRWPRRGQGCVIAMADGDIRIRLYDRTEGDALMVCGGPGGLSREERILRSDTTGVYAVTGRLEP